MHQKTTTLLKWVRRFFKRKASLVLTAFMLGMSNAILEEDRSINDTSDRTELPEQQSDEKP